MSKWMKMAGIRPSEITDEHAFKARRQVLKASIAAGLTGTIASGDLLADSDIKPTGPFDATDELTSFDTATSYNNFYELGTDKADPKKYAKRLKPSPWSVVVDGECAKPGTYTLEDILKPHAIEQRIYRLRCVEAWSMVIPWNGIPLADLLKRFEPTGNAKYVAFETVQDQDLPGMRSAVLQWPYREGLRMDEAMHPLSLVATGMYNDTLPNQNGAPLRLVVPWKYGYKSIKSIVKISFTEEQPDTSWNLSAPGEYGFYSNVNPDRSHPRWSQAKERRLVGKTSGISSLFLSKIDTEYMNGYGDQVASLYSGMDLQKFH